MSLITLAGCDKNATTKEEAEPAEPARAESSAQPERDGPFVLEEETGRIDDSTLESVDLPSVPEDSTVASGPGMLIIVERGRVLVSQASLITAFAAEAQPPPGSASELEEARETVVEQLEAMQVELIEEPREITSLEDGAVSAEQIEGGEAGFFLKAGFDELSGAVDEYQRAASVIARPTEMRAILAIDEDIPWMTVARVLWTVGQAQLDEVQLVVRTGDGARGRMSLANLELHAGRVPAGSPPEKVCARLTAAVLGEGTYLKVDRGMHGSAQLMDSKEVLSEIGTASDAESPKPPELPPWSGRVLVAAEGLCPTADAGPDEGETLARIASRFEAAQFCRSDDSADAPTHATVSTSAEVPFGRAVAVMAALRSTDVFDEVVAALPPDERDFCRRTLAVGD